MKLITDAWYREHSFLKLLLPLSFLFRCLIYLRRQCYRFGIFKSKRFPKPIIVVGNITVGGTGKTPLVIYLAQQLKQQGYKPGIVSRGYGGIAKRYPLQVSASSDPIEVGDEAVLIAARTQCPMVVDPKRINAAQVLLDQHDCDVLISDDGLQHYALARDIEIAVIDGARRLGNRWCLPAGPLREPARRLHEVDFVVVNGAGRADEIVMQLQPGRFINLVDSNKTQMAVYFSEQTIHAVAGIGNPQRFFKSLRELGLQIIEHPFPDHHRYCVDDLNFNDALPIVMTEKDAVKCKAFVDEGVWYLPVDAELDETFKMNVLAQLKTLAFN